MKNQALHDIIQNECLNWMQSINDCTDVGMLNSWHKLERKPNRKAIITARIENLTYLAI